MFTQYVQQLELQYGADYAAQYVALHGAQYGYVPPSRTMQSSAQGGSTAACSLGTGQAQYSSLQGAASGGPAVQPYQASGGPGYAAGAGQAQAQQQAQQQQAQQQQAQQQQAQQQQAYSAGGMSAATAAGMYSAAYGAPSVPPPSAPASSTPATAAAAPPGSMPGLYPYMQGSMQYGSMQGPPGMANLAPQYTAPPPPQAPPQQQPNQAQQPPQQAVKQPAMNYNPYMGQYVAAGAPSGPQPPQYGSMGMQYGQPPGQQLPVGPRPPAPGQYGMPPR